VLPADADYYTLYDKRNEANVGELINVALEAIEEANKEKLEGVFRTVLRERRRGLMQRLLLTDLHSGQPQARFPGFSD